MFDEKGLTLKKALIKRYGEPPITEIVELKKFAALAIDIFRVSEEEVWKYLDITRNREILYYFKKMQGER